MSWFMMSIMLDRSSIVNNSVDATSQSAKFL